MTGSDTDVRQKFRAMFLAFIMVTSVFGATVALSGSAVADEPTATDQDTDGVTVSPGETNVTVQEIQFTDGTGPNDANITNVTISMQAGNADNIDQVYIYNKSSGAEIGSGEIGNQIELSTNLTVPDSGSRNILVTADVNNSAEISDGDSFSTSLTQYGSVDDGTESSAGTSTPVLATSSVTYDVGSTSSNSKTNDDARANINVSIDTAVANTNGVNESTVGIVVQDTNNQNDSVQVVKAGEIVNGTDNGTNLNGAGGNVTVDVDVPLPDSDGKNYEIVTTSAINDDGGNQIIADSTRIGSTLAPVDMEPTDLVVNSDTPVFANTDGDSAATDEKATIQVYAVDKYGNPISDETEVNATVQLSPSDGTSTITNVSGVGNQSSPYNFTVSNTQITETTFTAYDTDASDSSLNSGEATQSFVGRVDDVSVSFNRTNAPTDGSAVQAQAQLLDANGDSVPKDNISVSFSFQNGSAAGVSATSPQTTKTNANGVATLNFTAANSGVTLGVTAIEQKNNNAGSASIQTVPGTISSSNTEFRLNDELIDKSGDDPTVQVATDHNVSVRVLDSNGNAIPAQSVTYTLNGSELTTVTADDSGYANASITLPEQKDTYILNASAGAFNASATGNAQVNITATAANLTSIRLAQDQQTTFAADSSNNVVTVEAVDQYGNINETNSAIGTLTLTSSDTNVFDFGGSASTTASFSSGTASVSSLNAGSEAGSADITATVPNANISNTSATFSVGEPQSIDVTFSSDVSTSSNSQTNQTATVTAQLLGPDGTAIGVKDENISFARQNGNAAELDQSASDYTVKTDSSGKATFQVNATSNTGETTFLAISDNYSAQGTGTITTTGSADGVSLSPAQTSLGVNESTTVTATFVDSAGRTVPRTSSVTLSASAGTVESPKSNATEFVNGVAEAQFTYNASTASASTATLTGVGGGVSGTAVIELTGETGAASVTFNDQTVANGSTSVTVADYDLGTEGQSVAIWTVSDGSPDQVIGQVNSSELDATNGSDLTVQLDSELTANTTLVAAVHSSTSPSASNIVVQDSASITVTQSNVPQNLQRFAGDDGQIDNLDVLNAVNAANSGGTVGGEPVGNLDILELVNYVTQQG
ncbi:beta strand repeat-containing protein (plasmid) [Haloplanus ruber]|uniref:Beta strand repeat-containing protein n=1 Tax=Haloplanus ruber TaxID=869892 RepID=A0ABD6D2C8_9EURY|nr:surface glycoprotein [Haloplanus ruber]